MRRRRTIIVAVALVAAVGAGPASGQAPERQYRLGHVALTEASEKLSRVHTLPELAKLGFVEGRNLTFSGVTGDAAQLPGLVRTLLASPPDAIIAIGRIATRAVRDATDRVPIVLFSDDPVRQGLAESLARPGGNATGIAIMVDDLLGKRWQLLIEALPSVRRAGALLKTSHPARAADEDLLRTLAAKAGIELRFFHADGAADYPAAFAAMRAGGIEALLIGNDPNFFADVQQLAALAREARLPTSCEWPQMARAGCLLGYGPDQTAARRRMAHYVARIFRGAAPGALPIEQPTQFEFAINLTTARALGLAIPAALLARADEVIE